MWAIDDPTILPENNTSSIKIQELEQNGYIDDGLINPMTDERYKNETHVEIKKESDNKYTYKIIYDGEKGC